MPVPAYAVDKKESFVLSFAIEKKNVRISAIPPAQRHQPRDTPHGPKGRQSKGKGR